MTAVGRCTRCMRLVWEVAEVGTLCGRRLGRYGERCDGIMARVEEAVS